MVGGGLSGMNIPINESTYGERNEWLVVWWGLGLVDGGIGGFLRTKSNYICK